MTGVKEPTQSKLEEKRIKYWIKESCTFEFTYRGLAKVSHSQIFDGTFFSHRLGLDAETGFHLLVNQSQT